MCEIWQGVVQRSCSKSECLHPDYLLFKSHLSNRVFLAKFGHNTSQLHLITAGVPQWSVLGPILYHLSLHLTYLVHLTQLWEHLRMTWLSFAAMSSLNCIKLPTTSKHVRNMEVQIANERQWIKVTHITFTLQQQQCPTTSDKVHYVCLHRNKWLTWKHHTQKNENK